MATQVTVLDASRPGNSLALWLALYQPDIFVALLKGRTKAATAAGLKSKMGALSDDSDDGTDIDDSDTADTDVETGDDSGFLDTITLPDDSTALDTLDPQLVTDQNAAGSAILSSAASATTSAGTTVGAVASSAGQSVLSAIGTVGASLTTPQALAALANTAIAYYKGQAASAAAAANLAALQAQVSLARSGQTVAPITYLTDPTTGVQTPALATTQANGQVTYTPLTVAQLAQLGASGLSSLLDKYGVWIAAAAGVLMLIWLATRNKEG
jgi:hypothetical protein